MTNKQKQTIKTYLLIPVAYFISMLLIFAYIIYPFAKEDRYSYLLEQQYTPFVSELFKTSFVIDKFMFQGAGIYLVDIGYKTDALLKNEQAKADLVAPKYKDSIEYKSLLKDVIGLTDYESMLRQKNVLVVCKEHESSVPNMPLFAVYDFKTNKCVTFTMDDNNSLIPDYNRLYNFIKIKQESANNYFATPPNV